jgi:DNA-binding NtrC family response regulator/tetratricopeptide (TPR) repeat protein
MTSPQEFVERGLYLDAAQAIDRSENASQELKVLRVWVESWVGRPVVAKAAAENLLTEQLTPKERVTCWETVGRLMLEDGNVHEGLRGMGKALDAASRLQDVALEARVIASCTELLLHCVGLEPATLELPKLRRAALRAGDPFSLIEFHSLNAEVSAQRGLLSITAASIDTARGLLSKFPNVAQEGRLANIASCLAAAYSDADEALRCAAKALECARSSGVRLIQLPALNNLVNVKLTQGKFEEARPFLDELLATVSTGNITELAYRDTQMLLAIATNDQSEAAEAATRIDALIAGQKHRDSYYELWHLPTRLRWLYRTGEANAGVEMALQSIPRLERRADNALLARVRLLAADGLDRLGRTVEAQRLLVDGMRTTVDPSLELIAEGLRVAGRLSARLNPRHSRSYFIQASRILAGIGHLAAQADVDREALEVHEGNAHSSADLTIGEIPALTGSIGVFLELGAHVPTLANEAFRMISNSGAAYNCVVAVSKEGGKREILASYTADDYPKGLNENTITIPCGSYGARHFEVSYVSRPATADRIALLTTDRLINAALAVSSVRLRNREQAASWTEAPPERQLGLVCASDRTRELVNTIRRVGHTNVTVLLTGETGVGKELFAHALHLASTRCDRTFLPFNCSTVSREMIDSQLFGHRRGSFTGAIGDSAGVIRSAAGGTLFLDEIGEMALETQPKLLRFLESGEILPLGETRPQIVDVRVVAATNANLDQLVADGRFREDLYYRLNVIRINIPPLRERREEIPALVEHFLERFGRELQKPLLRVAEETLEYLVLYRWPGNVRQLANEIRRLAAMAEPGGVIMPAHLSNEIAESRRTLPANRSPRLFDEVVTRIDQPLSAAVEHIERAAIQRALAMTDGHLDEAARLLGLSRKGLYLKRQRLNLG